MRDGGIINDHFGYIQICRPVGRLLREDSQKLPERLVSSLCLAVSLGVKTGRVPSGNPKPRLLQNREVKRESLSQIMERGSPWSPAM